MIVIDIGLVFIAVGVVGLIISYFIWRTL